MKWIFSDFFWKYTEYILDNRLVQVAITYYRMSPIDLPCDYYTGSLASYMNRVVLEKLRVGRWIVWNHLNNLIRYMYIVPSNNRPRDMASFGGHAMSIVANLIARICVHIMYNLFSNQRTKLIFITIFPTGRSRSTRSYGWSWQAGTTCKY